ncbi:hypothetical protein AVEN_256875-1 [Araneus ventricosus]|uniref:Uncharacterized protein n=1 Tax=Araneus ventricosus TaxID=182803 RepID=A0A4Y2CH94_ARAVE|nr:hypothetical protein AVEN_256875-1 [Araneus ventricosus]
MNGLAAPSSSFRITPAGLIDDESSVEVGFEPGNLRLRGRYLTTRPPRSVAFELKARQEAASKFLWSSDPKIVWGRWSEKMKASASTYKHCRLCSG